jgi:hypothetical protein
VTKTRPDDCAPRIVSVISLPGWSSETRDQSDSAGPCACAGLRAAQTARVVAAATGVRRVREVLTSSLKYSDSGGGRSLGCSRHFTEYLVNAPPAWLSEFGPSAA